jgi:hypothetical protein
MLGIVLTTLGSFFDAKQNSILLDAKNRSTDQHLLDAKQLRIGVFGDHSCYFDCKPNPDVTLK